MTSEVRELVRETDRRFAELRRAKPEEIHAFGVYLKRARSAGALSAKTKELMNLGIALAVHCTPCVIRHTKMSLAAGATRDEILETALVAIGMGGGLAYTQTMYMMQALEEWGAQSEAQDEKAQLSGQSADPAENTTGDTDTDGVPQAS